MFYHFFDLLSFFLSFIFGLGTLLLEFYYSVIYTENAWQLL